MINCMSERLKGAHLELDNVQLGHKLIQVKKQVFNCIDRIKNKK